MSRLLCSERGGEVRHAAPRVFAVAGGAADTARAVGSGAGSRPSLPREPHVAAATADVAGKAESRRRDQLDDKQPDGPEQQRAARAAALVGATTAEGRQGRRPTRPPLREHDRDPRHETARREEHQPGGEQSALDGPDARQRRSGDERAGDDQAGIRGVRERQRRAYHETNGARLRAGRCDPGARYHQERPRDGLRHLARVRHEVLLTR